MKKLAIEFSPMSDTIFAEWGIQSQHGLQVSLEETMTYVMIRNSSIVSDITPEREAACVAAAEKGPDALHEWIKDNVWGTGERVRQSLGRLEVYEEDL